MYSYFFLPVRKAPFLCLFKYLISMFLLETCERKWPLLPQKSLCYTNHTFSVRHDLWGESIIYRSQAFYKKHLPQSLRKRTEIAWCCWRPKFTTRAGGELSTAQQGWDKDRTMTMVGSLKTLQVNISSLIMKVIPLVNNYKWKAYHILDQKTCIKISLTPDLTEIKLWTEGGLGEALGVLKTTFSFSD